ncbi:MAG: glycoside hydrolase family 3 N-terminal domain-containing protein [Gemmatimonadales bacterium]|nr:glycoside hydrolase family 3 N-terminal domain-containing protein [Gemmatimonadales bacterium]
MSVRDKAAQLLMPWISGRAASDTAVTAAAERRWADSLRVGGVIVSIGPSAQIAARLDDLQGRAPLPLLVGSDLEGGSAMRITDGTAFPTAMGVAAGGREADAEAMGRITAREARAVGIHLVFAPVADVNSNPDNPVINTRAFGEDAALVARYVRAHARGLRAGGALAVAKHFPGHGDLAVDSHLRLGVIAADSATAWTRELRPFRAAIAAGVTGVMTAHIALPALDSGRVRAASLSPALTTGLLRERLRFRGIVVTDALDMAGAAPDGDPAEAAVQALEAGADLLLMPPDPAAALDALVRAVETGRVPEARLDASVRRLLALKRRLGLFRDRRVPLARVSGVVGAPAHRVAADSAAARSVVLVRDDGTVLRLRAAPARLLVLACVSDPKATDSTGVVLAAALRLHGHDVTLARVAGAPDSARADSLAAAAAAVEAVVIASGDRWATSRGRLGLPEGTVALLGRLRAERPAVLVALGSPYVLRQLPDVGAYLVAWSSAPASERAVAAALSGAALRGRLPISLMAGVPAGTGVLLPARAVPLPAPTAP